VRVYISTNRPNSACLLTALGILVMRLLPSCFLNKFRNAPLLAYFRVVAAVRACLPHPDSPLLSPECERVSASVQPSCLPQCVPPPVHSRPTPRDFVVAPLLTPRLFSRKFPPSISLSCEMERACASRVVYKSPDGPRHTVSPFLAFVRGGRVEAPSPSSSHKFNLFFVFSFVR
jgi:hypothetical protein